FIGSPPMNFFHGSLVQNGSTLSFQEQTGNGALPPKSIRLALDAPMAARVRSHAGKPVVLGIRPELITHQQHSHDAAPGQMVEAVAEAVMPMGAETHLQLASAAHSFVARVAPSQPIAPNQSVSLLFQMSGAHFFDPATQTVII